MNLYTLLNKEITQQELLNYYNANITYESLPLGINGLVFPYRGIYNIYINKNLSLYKKKKTIIHEIAHIELNQFEQYDNMLALKRDGYEDEADRYVKFILENTKN